MSVSKRKAVELFESFTGSRGQVVGKADLPELPEVLVLIGNVEAIAYNAVHDGKRKSFQHEFRVSSRPVLASSPDGTRLFLLAGAYRFTDRGIEDR